MVFASGSTSCPVVESPAQTHKGRKMKTLSEILLTNHFLLYGTIDVEMARKFTEWLAASRQTDLFVGIIVNCNGGQDTATKVIYGLIRQVQKEGLPVVSLTTGAALSNGVAVALAADERYMLKEAIFMFHRGMMDREFKLQGNEGLEETIKQQQLRVENFRRDDYWFSSVIAKRCGQPRSEVLSRMGSYLRAADSKAFGLVHHIL
jgi:ATP-dependent protease ClpP protease subunit